MPGLGVEPAFRRGLGLGVGFEVQVKVKILKQEQALRRYVIGFMACVGLAYYAGLLCDAWPFLQLQPQRPAPSPHTPAPPPHPVPDHTIGGGAGNARRLTIHGLSFADYNTGANPRSRRQLMSE